MIIYKYKIEVRNQWFTLDLPEAFKPLAFQEQKKLGVHDSDSLCFWALLHIKLTMQIKPYEFLALGTGIEIEDMYRANYIGTTQSEGFVWHLFWREIQE